LVVARDTGLVAAARSWDVDFCREVNREYRKNAGGARRWRPSKRPRTRFGGHLVPLQGRANRAAKVGRFGGETGAAIESWAAHPQALIDFPPYFMPFGDRI
jgi:hypothetical protein